MPDLSIAIPCYNEAKNIPLLLGRFSAFANRDFELILVNNGSTDETQSVLKKELPKYKFARSVTINKNIGYGNGIMAGLRAAKAGVVAYTHADLQCSPADVFRAFDAYNENGRDALVKGVRIRRNLSSAMLARCLDLVATSVMRMRFYDINAQPKLFSRDFLRQLDAAPDGYYLDLFIVAKAKRERMKIKEIPVVFEKRIHGVSSWQTNMAVRIRNIIRFFFACFEVRRRIR